MSAEESTSIAMRTGKSPNHLENKARSFFRRNNINLEHPQIKDFWQVWYSTYTEASLLKTIELAREQNEKPFLFYWVDTMKGTTKHSKILKEVFKKVSLGDFKSLLRKHAEFLYQHENQKVIWLGDKTTYMLEYIVNDHEAMINDGEKRKTVHPKDLKLLDQETPTFQPLANFANSRDVIQRMNGRTPPHSIEAESELLGSALIDNECLDTLSDQLKPEQFYKQSHRVIYQRMLELHHEGEPVDFVTLVERLRNHGELERIGSPAYLIGLADMVGTAAYFETYMNTVIEKATLREIISESGKAMQQAFDESKTADALLDEVETRFHKINTGRGTEHFEHIAKVMVEATEWAREVAASGNEITGIPSGFKEYDKLTLRFSPFYLQRHSSKTRDGQNFFSA